MPSASDVDGIRLVHLGQCGSLGLLGAGKVDGARGAAVPREGEGEPVSAAVRLDVASSGLDGAEPGGENLVVAHVVGREAGWSGDGAGGHNKGGGGPAGESTVGGQRRGQPVDYRREARLADSSGFQAHVQVSVKQGRSWGEAHNTGVLGREGEAGEAEKEKGEHVGHLGVHIDRGQSNHFFSIYN